MYAHYLQPLEEYNANDISKLTSDPLYKEFLQYKEEAAKLGQGLLEAMQREDDADIFKYEKPDTYFGDEDGSGSWNSTPLDWNMKKDF